MNTKTAIETSVAETRTVRLDFSPKRLRALFNQCSDHIVANGEIEFWGYHDGSEWRVHLSARVETDDDSGIIHEILNDSTVLVGWDSGVTTACGISDLRAREE